MTCIYARTTTPPMPTDTPTQTNPGRENWTVTVRDGNTVRNTGVGVVLLTLCLSLVVPTPTSSARTHTLKAWCKENAFTLPYAALIAEVFTYEPRMVLVSCCESRGIATAKNSKSTAVGLFQVMRSVWGKYAIKHEYDLLTAEGNIAVAAYILQVQGIKAWNESRHCWA